MVVMGNSILEEKLNICIAFVRSSLKVRNGGQVSMVLVDNMVFQKNMERKNCRDCDILKDTKCWFLWYTYESSSKKQMAIPHAY